MRGGGKIAIAIIGAVTVLTQAALAATPYGNSLMSGQSSSPQDGANQTVAQAVISGNGSAVVLETTATNLVSGFVDHTGGTGNVFVHNVSGTTNLVTHQAGSTTDSTTGGGQLASISDDGRYIAYIGYGNDFISPYTAGTSPNNIYVYDSSLQTNTLVSHAAGALTTGADGFSTSGIGPTISSDGSTIVYWSAATNLVSGFTDTNGNTKYDLYRYDRATGINTLITHTLAGSTTGSADGPTVGVPPVPTVSGDGSYVAYGARSTDLVTFTNNNGSGEDIFMFDANTGNNQLVTHTPDGSGGADATAQQPVFAENGSRLVYETAATNLINGFIDGNGPGVDVWAWKRGSDKNQLVSFAKGAPKQSGDAGSASGAPGVYPAAAATISDNGKSIAYESDANDLTASFVDHNANQDDVFLWTEVKKNGKTKVKNTLVTKSVINPATDGQAGAGSLYGISGDGKHVAYSTGAIDAVSGFTDSTPGAEDLFEYNTGTKSSVVVSHTYLASTTAANASVSVTQTPVIADRSVVADDGSVVYSTKATDVVFAFVNHNATGEDVYRYGP